MRDIVGYEGFYSVTECGKVFTHRRNKFMSPGSSGGGRYMSVTLTRDGTPKGFLVHRLVALAFIENPLNKLEVNHMDGDRLNNHVSNLEWCTRMENVHHAMDMGLKPMPPAHTLFRKGDDPRRQLKSKLTDDQVVEIRQRWDDGENYREIARDYPVDESNIRKCCTRQYYANIV